MIEIIDQRSNLSDSGRSGESAHVALTQLSRVEMEPLRERTYRALKRALLAGRFAPGQSITIKSLAEALGTGVMPVRESVQRLVCQGALCVAPNRSVRIPAPTQAEFEEILDLRLLLECHAGALAADRISAPEVASIAARERDLHDMVAGRATSEQLLAANQEFHFSVYSAARSSHLLQLIELLWLRIGPLLIEPLRPEASNREAYLQGMVAHAELVHALQARDAERCAGALRTILTRSADWYRANFRFSPEGIRGSPVRAS